jgi:erythromycin esterase
MKKILCLSVLFIFALLFNSCKNSTSVEEPQVSGTQIELSDAESKIVSELNKFITPLKGSSPSLDNSDLAVFDKFAGATVIALGEATHGSREFFQMKHRIFKYFVEKHGYRIFGFEADMGECIYIDRFITKGIGTIDEMMKKMHFWTWRTEEVKDLILWMKDYNTSKAESNQIHMLGVDCQYTNYNGVLIMEYLDKYDNNYPEYLKSITSEINILNQVTAIPVDQEKYDLIQKKCDSVLAYFEAKKAGLIAKSGKFEYDLITRLIEQSRQYLETFTKTSFNYRDLYMAKNTVWLTTLLDKPTKVISWAHDMHIAKDPNYTDGSQGYYLSNELGANYKAIGQSFNQGSFIAREYSPTTKQYSDPVENTIERLPLRGSFNYIFHAAIPKDFIIIFSDVPASNPLYTWFKTTAKFMFIGAGYNIQQYSAYYSNCEPIPYYDAMVHFQRTSSAIPYK